MGWNFERIFISPNCAILISELPTAEISPNPYPTMLEGDTLTLTCKTNEVTSQIKWEKNNVLKIPRANITKNGDSSILVIEKVEVSDSGEYSCEARNKAGSVSSSVNIQIKGNFFLDAELCSCLIVVGECKNLL